MDNIFFRIRDSIEKFTFYLLFEEIILFCEIFEYFFLQFIFFPCQEKNKKKIEILFSICEEITLVCLRNSSYHEIITQYFGHQGSLKTCTMYIMYITIFLLLLWFYAREDTQTNFIRGSGVRPPSLSLIKKIDLFLSSLRLQSRHGVFY